MKEVIVHTDEEYALMLYMAHIYGMVIESGGTIGTDGGVRLTFIPMEKFYKDGTEGK